MEIIPIIVLSNNNVEDLFLTLSSLEASDIGNSPIMIVDTSDNENKLMKSFLYSSDEIKLSFPSSRFWSFIPKKKIISNFSEKYNVIRPNNDLKNYSILYGINLAFNVFPFIDYCVIIESGIVLNKNWINESKNLIDKNSIISIISANKELMITKELYLKLYEYNYFSSSELNQDLDSFEAVKEIASKLGFKWINSERNWAQLISKEYDENFVKPMSLNLQELC